jgi:hypothetical protein
MSLTSYRAAPPRVTDLGLCCVETKRGLPVWEGPLGFVFVNGFVIRICTSFNAWRRPTLPTLER